MQSISLPVLPTATSQGIVAVLSPRPPSPLLNLPIITSRPTISNNSSEDAETNTNSLITAISQQNGLHFHRQLLIQKRKFILFCFVFIFTCLWFLFEIFFEKIAKGGISASSSQQQQQHAHVSS